MHSALCTPYGNAPCKGKYNVLVERNAGSNPTQFCGWEYYLKLREAKHGYHSRVVKIAGSISILRAAATR